MPKVPTFFRTQGQQVLQNYSFVDIASGSGYVQYYLASDQSGYVLTPQQIYSDVVTWATTSSTPSSTPDTKVFDNTFLQTLNVPRTVRGKVLVNVSALSTNPGGGNFTKLYFIAKLIRVRGGNETTIATGTSTLAQYAATADHDPKFLITMDVSTTLFKKGDQIGIRLEAYYWQNASNSGLFLKVGFDPKDRTSILTAQQQNALTSTISTVHIPFRIDL